jgi:hypothetical protein
MAGRKYLSRLCFTFDPLELGQGGTPKIRYPQSSLFPKNDFCEVCKNATRWYLSG